MIKGPVSKRVKLNFKRVNTGTLSEGMKTSHHDDKCRAVPVLGDVRYQGHTDPLARYQYSQKGVSGMAPYNYWELSLRFLCHSP